MSSKTVNTPDAKYAEYQKLWKKCRDAIKGHDTIQEEGEEYLPKLSGQNDNDYQKYLRQALFYNASGRTFKGYKGLIFRKDPDINADSIEEFVKDCTLSGKSLKEFAELAVEEELKVSRFGILVDHPPMDKESNLSQAEAQQRGIRPFLTAYFAEDILGKPKIIKVGSRNVLGQVRLRETYEATDSDDEFKTEPKKRVRVLDLTTDHSFDTSDPVYRQRVFYPKNKDSKNKGTKENNSQVYVENTKERRFPLMDGKPIKEIPFYMNGGYEYREPQLIDLVNVNLSHYVAYADHRRGVAWTTRPQPWRAGPEPDEKPDEPMVLGGGTLWEFPEGTQVDMLEYSGSGLTASENTLKELKEDMANLGARMLMPENTSEETATEFVIKKQGENSALGNVSQLVSEALTPAMQFAARWMGVAEVEDINIKLNTDFIPFDMSTEDMIRMWSLVQSGAPFTADDWLWNAKQGERLNPTIDDEERLSQMETNPPQGMSFNSNSNGA